MTAPAGRVVLILGMHRSGTSLLARILGALGLPLGQHLLTASTPDNPHGYWEQAEIVAIQEALLDGLGRRWFGRKGAEPLPAGWQNTARAHEAKQRLAAILAREMAAAGPLWGFKDPRSLRFLPLWMDILAAQNLEPWPILALRRPGAVAASLMRRNGLSRRFAERLWAFNTIEAWEGLGGRPALILDYDLWFTDPQATAAHLKAHLGLTGDPATAARLVDPGLRHDQGAPAALPAFEALHRALIARAPLSPDPEAISAALAAAHHALAPRRRRIS